MSAMTDVFKEHKDLPWYRSSAMNLSPIVPGGLIFPPLIWRACINCLTGDIYINGKDEDGSFKVWSKTNLLRPARSWENRSRCRQQHSRPVDSAQKGKRQWMTRSNSQCKS
jgi:hypothetical protein